jgi:lipopolysaccharide export system protein LptA
MRGFVRVSSLVIVLLFSLSGMSPEAQTKKGTEKADEKTSKATAGFGFSANSRAPIDITSDTVEGEQKQNRVTFKGNVVAKQEDMTLYADTVVVYYNPDTKKLKEIMAVGNVKIIQSNRRASGNKVIFLQDENKAILEGDAVLREDDNVIRGERITYFVDEERSVVEAGKGGRVSMTLVPKKE